LLPILPGCPRSRASFFSTPAALRAWLKAARIARLSSIQTSHKRSSMTEQSTDVLVQQFLRAVKQAAEKEGWPVNAYMIGPAVFKGDHVSNWKMIRLVLAECEKQRLLDLRNSGEIHGFIHPTEIKPATEDKK
jgi:hypothetical protein